MVYLGPHLADTGQRPELTPYIARMQGLCYQFRRGRQQRLIKTIRRVG